MRHGRQAVAAILAVMMLLTGLPVVAAAPRETGPFDGIYQGESPEGGTEVPVGTGQPHTTLRSVLEDGGLSGDIIVRLAGDQIETQTESTGPLVVPERFTSLTITADTGVKLKLKESHSRTQFISIFN